MRISRLILSFLFLLALCPVPASIHQVSAADSGTLPGPGPAVAFSHKAGFYTEGFTLTLAPESGGTIYYTLDGSEPDPAQTTGSTYRIKNQYPHGPLITRTNRTLVYGGPIQISSRRGEPNDISEITTAFNGFFRPGTEWEPPDGEVFKATVVRARVIGPDAIPGPVVTKTFFVDEDMAARYTLPVISLVTPERGLFDFEQGIYVPGKTFNDWRLANPAGVVNGSTPANYLRRGRDWELPAHIEFYEPGGVPAFARNFGMRIHGGWSRSHRQKALRLYARSDYDETSAFNHPLFPGHQKQGGHGVLRSFKRFILHISGQDNGLTMFRDALAQSLIAHTGIDTQAYRPAIVFLNGEYWGIHNIRERYDRHYVATNYDLNPDDVVILERNAAIVEGTPGDQQHFTNLRNFAETRANAGTLDQPANWSQIEQWMDVDNFMHHHIAQIYYANIDWPAGNLRWWRHKGDADPARHGHDGKWRWMLYDTDHGFGLFVTPGWGGWNIDAAHDTVAHALSKGTLLWSNPLWSTSLFRSLLENQTFRDRFLNTFSDHLNTSFKAERVVSRINEMQAVLAPEYPEFARRWNQPATFWSGGDTWEEKVQVMRDFAGSRPAHVRQYLRQHFNLAAPAELSVDATERGGTVRVNSIDLRPGTPGVSQEVFPWTGIYFRSLPIEVEAVPYRGYRFVGWTASDDDGMILSPSYQVTLTGDLQLTANFEVDPDALATAFPSPHPLAQSDYVLSAWAADSPAGTYPPGMVIQQTDTPDPGLNDEMTGAWTLPYDLTSRSRVVGLGADGMAFINTANAQENEEAGYLGAALLALNTLDVDQAFVSWTGATVLPNSRVYHLRLQYRIGDEGPFQDVLDGHEQAVEYRRNPAAGHSEVIGPVALPSTALNRPCVQLRWKYYFTGERVDDESGQRAMLGLDDILVSTGGPVPRHLAADEFHPAGQTGKALLPFDVRVEREDGVTDASFNGTITLSIVTGPGNFAGGNTQTAGTGVAAFAAVAFDTPGVYHLQASADGLDPLLLPPVRIVSVTELLMPRFIQGEAPENNNRVPFAYRVRLDGLEPDTVYRYANRVVTEGESPIQDGAGNMIFVTAGSSPFLRTTESPRFREGDFGTRHLTFMTDAGGSFTGWFITEPSGNPRFTPGGQVLMRILLNDGEGGEDYHHFLTTAGSVTVLSFGVAEQEASGIFGAAYAGVQTFVALYDLTNTGRPLAATLVENAGFPVDERYAQFYIAEVSGRDRRWGSLVPNNLSAGVVRVEQFGLFGESNGRFHFPEGLFNTINARHGAAAQSIEIEPGVATYQAWRMVHTWSSTGSGDPGGPLDESQPDGTPNLLKYALGLAPEEEVPANLMQPQILNGALTVSFPRNSGLTDIIYRIEASDDLSAWPETIYDSGANPGENNEGQRMRITDTGPFGEGGQRFLRLRITLSNE